jgi:hypothetical protein
MFCCFRPICCTLQLEGSIKSAQHLFSRYDMDLDGRLCPQDFYDLMLELNLALPYPDYQRFVDACFAHAGTCNAGHRTPDHTCLFYEK